MASSTPSTAQIQIKLDPNHVHAPDPDPETTPDPDPDLVHVPIHHLKDPMLTDPNHDHTHNHKQTHIVTVVVKKDTRQKNVEQTTPEYKNIKLEKQLDLIDTKSLQIATKEHRERHG